MSYASYRHLLRKWSILDQNQIPLALSVKNCGIQLKKVGDDKKNEKTYKKLESQKSFTALTWRSTV